MLGSEAELPPSFKMKNPPGLPPLLRQPPAPSLLNPVQPLPKDVRGTSRSKLPLTIVCAIAGIAKPQARTAPSRAFM